MNDAAKSEAPKSYAKKAWQSDVIVDLIKHYGFPYIALNPGASYRGLHDSLVNYGGNDPPILLCQHEKIAVQIAHGYAKATGRPMVAIVHDVVGMLHATMGIYYAYLDRCPIFVIGATGPMDESRRRPFIDWIHTANVNGEQLRHYVKWDYQPASIDGVPDSFARAYAAMMTEPQGPIYMCYDAWLQEQPLAKDVALPQPSTNKVPVAMAADGAALAEVAERLLAAKYPVLMAEYVARSAGGFDNLVALAETVGAAVFDVHARLNFPNRHRLNLSCEKEIFRDADLIVLLDVRDWEKSTHFNDRTRRQVVPHYPPACQMIDVGFGEIEYQQMVDGLCAHADLQPARARRHADRDPRTHPAVPRAHRQKSGVGQTRGRARHGGGGETRRAVQEMGGRCQARLGRRADRAAAAGERNMGRDQTRGLGAHRLQSAGLGL